MCENQKLTRATVQMARGSSPLPHLNITLPLFHLFLLSFFFERTSIALTSPSLFYWSHQVDHVQSSDITVLTPSPSRQITTSKLFSTQYFPNSSFLRFFTFACFSSFFGISCIWLNFRPKKTTAIDNDWSSRLTLTACSLRKAKKRDATDSLDSHHGFIFLNI